MPEDNLFKQQKPENQESIKNTKKEFIKFGIIFVLIVLVIFSSVLIYKKYKQNKFNQQQLENYQNYLNWEKRYEEAMKNDTYGGKTPEETLQMFIEALQKEDIELASKYFALNTNEKSEYYLTRKEWEEGLRKIKEKGEIGKIVNILLKVKPDKNAAISKDYYVFTVKDESGNVLVDIDMIFNKFSGVWKIESM